MQLERFACKKTWVECVKKLYFSQVGFHQQHFYRKMITFKKALLA
ncbi:hypothetical protein pah_c253o001 [Parachlamydia acanthamoebae str. Hall's coccus]|nr:hypothetical protein pah_c253o001 [Parachlamydia acanthamoebae str. Hall's coccus]